MNTYRIDKKDLKNKNVLAEGYKVFKNDWSTKHGNYCYADENGNVIGTFHKVDGNIEECKWGLHFSKNPFHCFNFYESVQWNKFAKVRAYENIIECGEKTVAQVIEIVETYTFDEFIEILKKYDWLIDKGIIHSNGVNYSKGVNNSKGVNCSDGVNISYGVNYSKGVNNSKGVNRSNGVNDSDGVNYSKGVNNSKGVNHSYGITKCEGISNSCFCFGKSGKNILFNKKATEERIQQIKNNIDWYPIFNNAFEMKENVKEWYEVNIPSVLTIDNKTAWGKMPSEVLKYIQSLPEYNEKIFKKITGDIDD